MIFRTVECKVRVLTDEVIAIATVNAGMNDERVFIKIEPSADSKNATEALSKAVSSVMTSMIYAFKESQKNAPSPVPESSSTFLSDK